jgi:SDR family mycofactocin-dependent oxidoreductase
MTKHAPHRFDGKVAFITGAARGQGRAEAVRLAEEGANIIAIDICSNLETPKYELSTPEDLAETVRLVEKTGQRIVARKADVRDFDAVSSALAEGVAEFGRLDVVVANAAICTAAMSWEITAELWKETLEVNLTGAFHTAKAAIPVLIDQGTGGAIIMTSSVAGLRGLPFLGHYVAAKHGVTGLAKTMAVELGEYNIRVNTIHPHGVATGMNVPDMVEFIDKHAETLGPIFMGSLPDKKSEPQDIANAVAWLASDEARHVTGIQLPLDLGTLVR